MKKFFFLFQCLLFILLSPSPCVVIVYIIKKGVRQKVLDILCNCKLMLVIDAEVSDSKNREQIAPFVQRSLELAEIWSWFELKNGGRGCTLSAINFSFLLFVCIFFICVCLFEILIFVIFSLLIIFCILLKCTLGQWK